MNAKKMTKAEPTGNHAKKNSNPEKRLSKIRLKRLITWELRKIPLKYLTLILGEERRYSVLRRRVLASYQ